MNRNSKTIRSHSLTGIHTLKCQILTTAGRWFDADGNAGKSAIKELRASGHVIEYNRERGSYRLTP